MTVSKILSAFVSSVLLLGSLPGVAHADGIKSKGKARIPMSGDFIPVDRVKLREPKPWPVKYTLKTDVVAMQVRRNIRRHTRRNKLIVETKTAQKAAAPQTVGAREKLVERGNARLPDHCMALHTSERSQCIKFSAYRKTKRMQFAVMTRIRAGKGSALHSAGGKK